MKTFAKIATAAAVAGALALSMATPSFAASSHHQTWSQDRAASGDNQSYGYATPGYGDVNSGYGAYASVPRTAVSGSTLNEEQCMMSPGSQGYEPCFNN